MSSDVHDEIREELRRYLLRSHRMGREVLFRGRDGGSAAAAVEEAVAAAGETPAAGREGAAAKTAAPGPVSTAPVAGRNDEIALRTSVPKGVGFRREVGRARQPAQEGLFDSPQRTAEPAIERLGYDELERVVAACTKCPLSETRTNTVFGSGDHRAGIVFIGEAPGRDEDQQGLPFVGRAGQLLTKMLAAIGLGRGEVYITNILKCRPPNNRDPNEEEVGSCEGYLARQIELIGPAVICALGRIAAQNLLDCKASLSMLRESIHYYNDIKVLVTYHPAALLRNPHLKPAAWEDLKALRSVYDEFRAQERER